MNDKIEQTKKLMNQWRIEQFHEETLDAYVNHINDLYTTPENGELLLSDESQFNLVFQTSYTAESTELLAYQEGVNDGTKAQLSHCKPIIEARVRKDILGAVEIVLSELVDIMDAVHEGIYEPDCFTTQPAKNLLATLKSGKPVESEEK
jgi:hypothetical protein